MLIILSTDSKLEERLEHYASRLLTTLEKIAMNQQEQTQALTTIGDGLTTLGATLQRAADEINAEIQTLKDAVANAGNSTPEMDAAFQNITDRMATVTAVADGLDNLNPNTGGGATTPPPIDTGPAVAARPSLKRGA